MPVLATRIGKVVTHGLHTDSPTVVKVTTTGLQFDNLFGNNHKVVTLTTSLTTFRQPFVLCVDFQVV